jgi:hypothetical protein
MADNQKIQNHVIEYFAWRFSRHASEFTRATKVRDAYENNEDWEALADTFNNTNWMQALHVKLRQQDMDGVSTIGEVTDLIAGKASSS